MEVRHHHLPLGTRPLHLEDTYGRLVVGGEGGAGGEDVPGHEGLLTYHSMGLAYKVGVGMQTYHLPLIKNVMKLEKKKLMMIVTANVD